MYPDGIYKYEANIFFLKGSSIIFDIIDVKCVSIIMLPKINSLFWLLKNLNYKSWTNQVKYDFYF